MARPCSIADCGNDVAARDLCRMHYYRWKRTGTTDLIDRRRTCTFEGCGLPAHGNGYCKTHYARVLRHGDPGVRLRRRDDGPDETRWMQKVSIESPGCWMWTAGSSGETGYAAYSVAGRSINAHRYIYEILVGPIPEGMELDHLCRRRSCVNPDHLEPVTHLINHTRGAHGAGKLRPKRRRPS